MKKMIDWLRKVLSWFKSKEEPQRTYVPLDIEMPEEGTWWPGKLCPIDAHKTLCPYNCLSCRSEGNVMKYAFLIMQRIADSTEGIKGVEQRLKMDELRGKRLVETRKEKRNEYE